MDQCQFRFAPTFTFPFQYVSLRPRQMWNTNGSTPYSGAARHHCRYELPMHIKHSFKIHEFLINFLHCLHDATRALYASLYPFVRQEWERTVLFFAETINLLTNLENSRLGSGGSLWVHSSRSFIKALIPGHIALID